MRQGQNEIPAGFDEGIAQLQQASVFFSRTEFRPGQSLKHCKAARDILLAAALGPEFAREHKQSTRDLEHHADQPRVGRVGELDQVPHDIETGRFQWADSGSTRVDFGQTQLLDFPQGFADGAPLNRKPLGEVALGRQPVAGLVSTVQDVVSQIASDAIALGSGGHALGGWARWWLKKTPIWYYQIGSTKITWPDGSSSRAAQKNDVSPEGDLRELSSPLISRKSAILSV